MSGLRECGGREAAVATSITSRLKDESWDCVDLLKILDKHIVLAGATVKEQ